MVGPASKNVEADRSCRSVTTYRNWHPVSSTANNNNNSNRALCTLSSTSAPVPIKTELEIKQEPDVQDLDTVYGTYDEATNSITIIYPGEENGMAIQECVQEVSTDGTGQTEDTSYLTPNHCYSNQFSPAYTCTDTMSPSSIHSEDTDAGYTAAKSNDATVSDGGYESHGSPCPEPNHSRAVPLTDLWHESFSELFPTLA